MSEVHVKGLAAKQASYALVNVTTEDRGKKSGTKVNCRSFISSTARVTYSE